MCPASSFSIFQPSFVATATFLELSVTLRHHLYTSVTGAVLFILSVAPPPPLSLFVFVSFLTVRYLSSLPVLQCLLNGLDGPETQWTACDPSDQSSFMYRLSLLFCFCLSVRKERNDLFIGKEVTNLFY